MGWLEITAVGLAVGVIGTGLGGIIALFIGKPTDRTFGAVLGFAAGIMLAIIFLELIEEALETGFLAAASGFLLGVALLYLMDNYYPHNHFVSEENTGSDSVRYSKKGILIAAGIGLHNLPEGIAIGAGFAASADIGIMLAVLIGLHNIPEGIAAAVPYNVGSGQKRKTVLIAVFAGIPMGLGTFIGAVMGGISPLFLGISLGFAAGAMMYIVADELIPDVYELTNAHVAICGITAGILIGTALIHYV